jgi:hypothetical protein
MGSTKKGRLRKFNIYRLSNGRMLMVNEGGREGKWEEQGREKGRGRGEPPWDLFGVLMHG